MQRTAALLIKYGGNTPFTSAPVAFQPAIEASSKAMEEKYPKVTEAKIQGSKPHKSAKDPTDEKDVITVSYHTVSGTRVASIHVHEDMTYKEWPSRNASAGK